MLFDPSLFERALCAAWEKTELLTVVRRLVDLAGKAIRDGLLALDGVADERDRFTAQALRRVIDGADLRDLQEELREGLESGTLKGKALLEHMLVSEAIVGIANGVGPVVLELKLQAMLGEKIFFSKSGRQQ
jgi:flagellar motor component MotA